MTLDALGHTSLTARPDHHNEAVRYARRWFKQLYAKNPIYELDDDAEATFDVAGVMFVTVRRAVLAVEPRSEEHTSELQSLMRISYAVFCLKKQNKMTKNTTSNTRQRKTYHTYHMNSRYTIQHR